MPQEFASDFERKFKGEMMNMIEAGGYFPEESLTTPPDDDHPNGQERYKWRSGRLYQDGVLIAEWQLHQTLHHYRRLRNEKCFEECPICLRAGIDTARTAEQTLKLGSPYPDERRGEYPCPNQNCADSFNYQSHLMRHEEHAHGSKYDWKAFEKDLKENAHTQKCRYISSGRYSKQCTRDAQPGKLWCSDATHMEQVQAKINKGVIKQQSDEVELD